MTLPLAAAIRPVYVPALGTSTTEDANLTTLIAAADATLAAWCGYPRADGSTSATFEASTYTEYLHGPTVRNPRALRLSVRPVTSITSIHEDRDQDDSYGAADLVDSGDYTLDEVDGTVHLKYQSTHGYWGKGRRILKVIYVAGFDSGAEPALTQAIGLMVAHRFAGRHHAGIDALQQGGTTLDPQPWDIPAAVKEILWPYRLAEVGLG